MIAVLVATTLAWMGLEGAVASEEPHAHLPRELATGVALLAAHVAASVEYVVADRAANAAGVALLAAGIALRVWAIRTLGVGFVSTTTAPAELVRRGPYRVLRHPSEIGLLAAAAGAAVMLGSMVAAGVIVLALLPISIVRCVAEERTIAAWARSCPSTAADRSLAASSAARPRRARARAVDRPSAATAAS